MNDRRLFLAGLATLWPLAQARAETPSADAYPEIKWEALVPRDWDPLKEFRGQDMAVGLPDSDPRAQAMLERLRAIWDAAPTVPTLDGAKVRLPGFVVPLDESPSGLTSFLLVPYFGACIHTPPPPANQIIHVHTSTPAKVRTMDPVWVRGTLKLERQDTAQGTTAYRLDAAGVEPYVERPR
jgi:hypothetical protein